jgi:hypothetical protein
MSRLALSRNQGENPLLVVAVTKIILLRGMCQRVLRETFLGEASTLRRSVRFAPDQAGDVREYIDEAEYAHHLISGHDEK